MSQVQFTQLGKTRHAVDIDYIDYAIDRKSQKLYLLAKNRLQVLEFHSITGKFVQNIHTENGYSFLNQVDYQDKSN